MSRGAWMKTLENMLGGPGHVQTVALETTTATTTNMSTITMADRSEVYDTSQNQDNRFNTQQSRQKKHMVNLVCPSNFNATLAFAARVQKTHKSRRAQLNMT